MRKLALLFFIFFGFWGSFAGAKIYSISRDEALEALSDYRNLLTSQSNLNSEETDIKSDLLNQIILQTDIHFQGGDYKKFLAHMMEQLIDINSKSENRLGIDLRDYLGRLQNSIQDDMEPSENPAHFLTQFLTVNSILNPGKEASMDTEHAYSNGHEWIQVEGRNLEDAGYFAAAHPTDETKSDYDVKVERTDKLDDDLRLILSNAIATRSSDTVNESPGIIQLDPSTSPYDWILQNSISPY